MRTAICFHGGKCRYIRKDWEGHYYCGLDRKLGQPNRYTQSDPPRKCKDKMYYENDYINLI